MFGVKGFPAPVNVTLPDGTTLPIHIFGDESFSYSTNSEGYIIAQGEDGYYYFVNYIAGMRIISNRRATKQATKGFTKNIPYFNNEAKRLSNTLSQQDLIATKGTTLKTIVIPVQFSNLKFTSSSIRSEIYNLFNQLNYSVNDATGSVRDYFRDNLGTSTNFTFDVCNPVTLPASYSYYGANSSLANDANIKEMVSSACALAHSEGVNFSNYDFDNDGVVDNVFIIFAGYNEAEGGGDNTIWPQSWNISSMQLYYNGKIISNFSCYSEFSGSSGKQFAGIGTICHEYCHFLGLVDMYDVNGEVEGLSNGLFGSLSIMDKGNYNNGGKTPPYLTIFEREIVGVTYVASMRSGQLLEISPVYTSSVGTKMITSLLKENYYVEYRDGTKWDQYIGGEGLVIYHLDKTNTFAGSMSAALRWSSNAVNGCASHQCAELVSSTNVKMTDVTEAFFPGRKNVTDIHSARTFPLIDWQGKGTGLGLMNIRKEGNTILAEVVDDDTWSFPTILGYSIEPEQTAAKLKWSTDKTGKGEWNLVWKHDIDIYADTVIVSGNEYLFTNLIPGANYECLLYYTQGSLEGKDYPMPFQTTKMVSSFPLIAEMEKEYYVGETIRFHLLNLVEKAESIIWYVNGAQYNEPTLTFVQGGGSYTIAAEIIYSDGTTERLEKELDIRQSTSEAEDTY